MDELKIESTISGMPKSQVNYVRWGVFRIKQPRFWHDGGRIAKLCLLLKFIIAVSWMLIAFMYFLRLSNFDLFMEWSFLTIDVNGDINEIINRKL
ncbi:hypothetical protein [Photobacterium leiognathi]|uniref:hypothetical protein n=1 Tax=Photobacterium leiognathi TaxID=553611 RepID=UPI0029810E46|nr:hypothetical protein [Photobacterium leiognathi]